MQKLPDLKILLRIKMSSLYVTPSEFKIDSRFEEETYPVGFLPMSTVLLMDDRRYPWLVLIPRIEGVTELSDLGEAESQNLMQEIRQTMKVFEIVSKPDKHNVEALGNRIHQLHIHVIARFHSDEAWPRPVWNLGEKTVYPAHSAYILIDSLRDCFKNMEPGWISARP